MERTTTNSLVPFQPFQLGRMKLRHGLTKVARIGRYRSVYGQKRVEGVVGQSRQPKLSVFCFRTSAHPFLAKNRPGAPVFGHCPSFSLQNVACFRWESWEGSKVYILKYDRALDGKGVRVSPLSTGHICTYFYIRIDTSASSSQQSRSHIRTRA